MRGYHGKRHAGAAALAAFLLAGCHGLHHKSVAVAEPGLSESGVAVAPVELGRGERLWEGPEEFIDRFHLEQIPSPSGVVHHFFWRR